MKKIASSGCAMNPDPPPVTDEEKTGGKAALLCEATLEMFMSCVIDLCLLAYGKISLRRLHEIALSAPRGNDMAADGSAFDLAFLGAVNNVEAQIKHYERSQSDLERQLFSEAETEKYLVAMQILIPDAARLKSADEFFAGRFSKLAVESRSLIDVAFSDFLFTLMREPIFSFLCPLRTKPRWTFEEKFERELDPENIEQYLGRERKNFVTGTIEAASHAISWKDIRDYLDVLTEYSAAAQELIEAQLGYLPNIALFLPHEIGIRKVIARHRKEEISDSAFGSEVRDLVLRVRNNHMRKYGFDTPLLYGQKEFEHYNETLSPYINNARERLARFLGYYPDIQHSLHAEIYMRRHIYKDSFNPDFGLTVPDAIAMTAVKYREVLLTEGREAADHSPMIGEIKAKESY